jgi:hypothetical protein
MTIHVTEIVGGKAAVLPEDADRLRNHIAVFRSGGQPVTVSWRDVEIVTVRFAQRALGPFAGVQPPLRHINLETLDPMSRAALAAVIKRDGAHNAEAS